MEALAWGQDGKKPLAGGKENGLIMVDSWLFSFLSRCLAFVALIMLGCFMFQMKCCIECLLDIVDLDLHGSWEVLRVNLVAFLEPPRSTRTVDERCREVLEVWGLGPSWPILARQRYVFDVVICVLGIKRGVNG